MSNQMKGAYILMESLLKENVDTIFGYPGGSIMPTFDALYDYMDKFNYVLTRHEQGATHAAQGYARVSGKTGVCLVTSGPGLDSTCCDRRSGWSRIPWNRRIPGSRLDWLHTSYHKMVLPNSFGRRHCSSSSKSFPYSKFGKKRPCGAGFCKKRTGGDG